MKAQVDNPTVERSSTSEKEKCMKHCKNCKYFLGYRGEHTCKLCVWLPTKRYCKRYVAKVECEQPLERNTGVCPMCHGGRKLRSLEGFPIADCPCTDEDGQT